MLVVRSTLIMFHVVTHLSVSGCTKDKTLVPKQMSQRKLVFMNSVLWSCKFPAHLAPQYSIHTFVGT